MIHMIFVICVMLITLYILLKYKEKFLIPIESPRILKVQKDGRSAIVEWYNTNSNINEFVVLYVDIDKLVSGVWIENNVKCKKKRCRIVIKNLAGERYKLAVLSKLDNKLSDITEDDIITFSDKKIYNGYVTQKKGELESEGDNVELDFSDSENESNIPSTSTSTSKSKSTSSPAPAPAPQEKPTIDCRGGYVKLKNIKNKEELEEAEIKSECPELENLSEHLKKPFYHYYWEQIF